jgi:hypothetical protein
VLVASSPPNRPNSMSRFTICFLSIKGACIRSADFIGRTIRKIEKINAIVQVDRRCACVASCLAYRPFSFLAPLSIARTSMATLLTAAISATSFCARAASSTALHASVKQG